MEKKTTNRWRRLYNRVSKGLYDYRAWWFDGPSILLNYLYRWHFYSQGAHPVHPEFPMVFDTILWLYVVIKHRVRKEGLGIQERRGWIMVLVWVEMLMEFFLQHASHPTMYPALPPDVITTVFNVLLAFTLGVILKNRVLLRFSKLGDLLQEAEKAR